MTTTPQHMLWHHALWAYGLKPMLGGLVVVVALVSPVLLCAPVYALWATHDGWSWPIIDYINGACGLIAMYTLCGITVWHNCSRVPVHAYICTACAVLAFWVSLLINSPYLFTVVFALGVAVCIYADTIAQRETSS